MKGKVNKLDTDQGLNPSLSALLVQSGSWGFVGDHEDAMRPQVQLSPGVVHSWGWL